MKYIIYIIIILFLYNKIKNRKKSTRENWQRAYKNYKPDIYHMPKKRGFYYDDNENNSRKSCIFMIIVFAALFLIGAISK